MRFVLSLFVTSCLALPRELNTELAQNLNERPWLDTTLSPEDRAAGLVRVMTLQEKITMLHGSDGPYVGNVPENSRLGVPALKMNDGPQGFRDDAHPGTSTSFPCALSVAATWDETVAEEWGSAMGYEFFHKGANVQLGPGMNVARVPVNGRNFEYISGEDPVLGSRLVGPAIQGIQSAGVIANAKHFVHNNQEFDRTEQNSVVDIRTQHEIYFPPFRAAVEAGVGSFMCSYNKVNGAWACQNNDTLTNFLRNEIGFDGWVMSDWGATHNVSINVGLDQEMPGADFFGNTLLDLVNKGVVPQYFVDNSTLRIATQMFKAGLFDRPNGYNLDNNVTNNVNRALAQSIVESSVVMVKNSPILHQQPNASDPPRPLLPFVGAPSAATPSNVGANGTVVFRLGVFGAAALQPIVHGEGSGRVVPARVTAPLWSIRERFANIPATSNCSEGKFEQDVDYYQPGNPSVPATSVEECCSLCSQRGDCGYFTFQAATKLCWLKGSNAGRVSSPGLISGSCWKDLAGACSGDYCVSFETNADNAGKVASRSDAAVVFVETSSSEGFDRPNLSISPAQDALVKAVIATQPNTVLVAVTPGALLLPWRDQLGAILLAFMPGQEYGPAIARILFGDVNPSGHLPVTIPNVENEMKFTPAQYPGQNGQTLYSEHLQVGYRWYHANGVIPAYAFGHGLSYTSFEFSSLTVTSHDQALNKTSVEARVNVKNTGDVAGQCVAQLYVTFPDNCEEPPRQLKSFTKLSLNPGQDVWVTLSLYERDFSIFTGSWQLVPGTYQIEVGQSSDDDKMLSASVQLP